MIKLKDIIVEKQDADAGNTYTYTDGDYTYDVKKMWKLATNIKPVKISELEFLLDEKIWDDDIPRNVLKKKSGPHWERIEKANLNYPILLHPTGWIIDGFHRFCKAVSLGKTEINACRFTKSMMQKCILYKGTEIRQ